MYQVQFTVNKQKGADSAMKIAIPLAEGKLATHFGHCQEFAIMTIVDKKITKHETLTPPPHAPGVIPNWVADLGCTDIIVGGMGGAAQSILTERNVKVMSGAPSLGPEKLVVLYLNGELTDSGNACDHDHENHECGNH